MAKLDIKPVSKSRLAEMTEEMLKGKTQVKLFQASKPDTKDFENEINRFLKEKGEKIVVKDIKYTVGSDKSLWTAMVIYEVL